MIGRMRVSNAIPYWGVCFAPCWPGDGRRASLVLMLGGHRLHFYWKRGH